MGFLSLNSVGLEYGMIHIYFVECKRKGPITGVPLPVSEKFGFEGLSISPFFCYPGPTTILNH